MGLFKRLIVLFLLAEILLWSGCGVAPRYTTSAGRTHESRQVQQSQRGFSQTGVASYYARKFQGRKTASGERFDNNAFTAAHRTLPFNTIIRVTNTKNDKSVEVRVNDRGPHSKNRILDLSEAAARKIDLVTSGIATVRVEVVK